MNNSPSPSPRPNNLLPTVVLALAVLLNIPPTIIAVTTHFVNEHPWWSLFILLGFAIFDFAVYIIARLWQRLEGPWLDDIANWIDHKIHDMFFSYEKRYRKFLVFQHRDFDVNGPGSRGPYTLELDQVFIELSLETTTIDDLITNPIPQEMHEDSHNIWYYLSSPFLANKDLVIIGPPGSGKTTLLKHITLTLVAPVKHPHRQIDVPHKLPILLFLRDHVSAIHANAKKDKPDFSLIEALHDHLKRRGEPDPPAGWIKRQLDRGYSLVLLDGLDEVADPLMRKDVVDWVNKQMSVYRENRFIMTSRPYGLRDNDNSLTRASVAMLQARSFTPEQVEHFVDKWYLTNEIMSKQKDDQGVRSRAQAEARDLLQQLRNTPALLALTVNPLLLTMIAFVHRYGGGGQLPGKRVLLYAEICKVFLGGRQVARRQVLKLTPDQMQHILEPLANYMMQQGIRDITPDQARLVIEEPLGLVDSSMSIADFLKLVENVSGLLLEREKNGTYSFAHLTFQEYLTAVYISKERSGNTLKAHVENSWWQETIRLYCAMADATPIIEACLAGNPPSVPALVFAFDCQKEPLKLKREVKDRLEAILSQGMEDADPEKQHIAAKVLLAQRLRQMVYLKEDTFIDTSQITCAEYQLFLDEQRAKGKYYQPDHWKSYRFFSGLGHAPVLGVRPSDASAFCEWLTARETDRWSYRLPRAGELGQVGDENILNRFQPGTGYWLDKKFAWPKEPVLLTRNIVRDLIAKDRALNADLALNIVGALVRDFDLARNLDSALDWAFAFDRARTRGLDRARALAFNLDPAAPLALVRRHALDLANDAFSSGKKNSSKRERDEIWHLIDNYLDIYITFIVLEERMHGRLSACESILIARERKQDTI